MNKVAICIICIVPDIRQLDFYSKLSGAYDIYFMCDSEESILYDRPNVHIIQIADKEVADNGFINACTATINKTPMGWDKALYYFSCVNKTYEHIWFLEDDVFVPTKDTIMNIDTKYGLTDGVLIAGCIDYKFNKSWSHWPGTIFKINPPWYRSMVACVRISATTIKLIAQCVKKNRTLFFIESMIPTIAMQGRLSVKCIPELNTIYWRHTFTHTDIKVENIYHPIKDIHIQTEFRKIIGI